MGRQTTVSMAACISDFNIIAVAGVLFTDAQTPDALLARSYIAVIITGLMLLAVMCTLGWWRPVGTLRGMPRRPKTVGTVLSYLCGSGVVREWMEMRFGRLGESEMKEVVVSSGRRFRFGKMRNCVDEKFRLGDWL